MNAFTAKLFLNSLYAGIRLSSAVLRRYDYHFGESITTLDDIHACPQAEFNALRERGPVLRSYANRGWFVLGHKENTELFRDERLSNRFTDNAFIRKVLTTVSGRSEFPFLDSPSLQQLDPPDHTRVRKLVSKGFNHKYIRSLAPNIQNLVDELLDQIPQNASFDLVDALARPLPAIVIADMLGVPIADRAQFERWSSELLGIAELMSPDRVAKGVNADAALRDYMAALIERKRDDLGDDLISQWILAEEQGDTLTAEELYATCVLLLVAGHETTTRLIASTVYMFLKHPDQRAIAERSEEHMARALEEVLRLEPPVMIAPRQVKTSFEFAGRTLKQGQVIALCIAAANRDPKAFRDPERFDVSREDNPHLSFGYGIHLCLGITLARLEANIALRTLLRRFPDLQLIGEPPDWDDSLMFRGLKTLQVRA